MKFAMIKHYVKKSRVNLIISLIALFSIKIQNNFNGDVKKADA
jgi:hypothetical protein